MMGIPVVVSENGRGLPVRAVERGAPAMVVAGNGRGLPIVLSDNGLPFVVDGLGPTDPLAPYYASGAILRHIKTDNATMSGANVAQVSDAATGLLADRFNAFAGQVTIVGGMFNFDQAGTDGHSLSSEHPLTMTGNRLMFVLELKAGSANGQHLMTKDEVGVQFQIRFHINAANTMTLTLWANLGAGGVTKLFSGRIPNDGGKHIFEIEMTSTEAQLWIDGASMGTVTHDWTLFQVDRLGGLAGANRPIVGMDDVLLARSGEAAAFTAARAELARRHGLTVA